MFKFLDVSAFRFQIFCILMICLLPFASLVAQVKFPEAFKEKIKSVGIDIFKPVESNYKRFTFFSDFQHFDFAMQSRKEKLEIRYVIEPLEIDNPINSIPNVRSMGLATHLASNEENSMVSVHSLEGAATSEQFNADWGKTFLFKPKALVSQKKYCRMLSLYKEGRGIVHVLFLFDKPTEALESRFYGLRFE